MTGKRLRPIIIKEIRQIRRDRRSLMALLVLPSLLVFFIGYALNFDVKHISVAVFDQEKSQRSREFIRGFSNTEYFNVNYQVESYREIDRLLNEGKVLVAIVIPPNFSKRLAQGADVSIQILIDGTNANTATTAISYISSNVQTYSTNLGATALSRSGRDLYRPIDVRPRIWYNPDLVTAKFLVPGLIGFVLMLSAVVSTSLSVVREKERGTMDQLMVSTLQTTEIIIGKTMPYLFIGLIASTLVLIVGFTFFGIVVRGSLLWLYVGILVFLLAALGQGLLVSTIARTQQVAFMLAVFSSLLPTFLLSGFVFPIRSMPVVLQILSNLTPVKFFLIVVRGVILKGVGPAALWPQFVYLLLFASLTLGISSIRLLKKSA